MKALFFGVIADDLLFPFPEVVAAERLRLQVALEQLESLSRTHIDAAHHDAVATLTPAVLDALRHAGLFGVTIPARYGGGGFSAFAAARLFQELASVDPALALTLLVHETLGARSVLAHGTEAQRARLLPRLATGETLAAFALTERSAGSDAGTIRTYAAQDERSGGYRLNGEKFWVTNGALADVFVVFARTNPPDAGHKPRLIALLVERGPGVTTGIRHETLGVRAASITSICFDDVLVPAENVLGEPGKGMKVAMAALTDARVYLSAMMVGQSRTLVNSCIERLRTRRSFGRPIGEFSLTKEKTAALLIDTYASESMAYLTAGLADRNVEDHSLESSISRLASAEALWRIANEAMQVAAASGYACEQPFERRLRDARAGFVIDSTHEILRCFIALSGMQGPGRRLSAVELAMHEPVKGFGLLRDFAVRKVREALRRERFERAHPALTREAVLFEQSTEELARAVERALRDHGLEIAEMQHTQARIADIAVDLYAMAACITRASRAVERSGESGASRHMDLTTALTAAAAGRIKANLQRLEYSDDELRDAIASRTYADGAYPFDVL